MPDRGTEKREVVPRGNIQIYRTERTSNCVQIRNTGEFVNNTERIRTSYKSTIDRLGTSGGIIGVKKVTITATATAILRTSTDWSPNYDATGHTAQGITCN